MTKQRWEQVRQLEELPMDVFWEYYQEHDGIIKDFTTFKNSFEKYLHMGFKALINHHVKPINFTCALDRVYQYYNNKYTK